MISVSHPSFQSQRQLFVLTIFTFVAIAVGAFAAIGTAQFLALVALLLLAFISALTVPMRVLPIILAALVPFQFYFFVPGTSFAAPAALVFVATAAARVLMTRGLRGQVWIAPVALFLSIALIAALGATNRYEAFKGIYSWLPIFACAFIVAQTVDSKRAADWMIALLVGLGLAQAILGLVEYVAGLDRVISWLTLPLSEFIFPPNLLRERLSDLSFNWNLAGRALPFGTFINGIDYAIFLAAMTMLALARGIASAPTRKMFLWFGCALLLSITILLTLKGSGLLALAGGLGVLAIYFTPRLSRQKSVMLLVLGVIALILALPFLGVISDRVSFLVDRELGDSRNLGRLSIWSSLLPALVERPLFGFGMNNSPASEQVLRTLKFGAFGTYPVSPESAYVQVLIETGALGFIALLIFFAMTLARAVKNIRANQNTIALVGILAALVALWAGNLTVSAFTTDQNGMLMGLLIGLVFAPNLAKVASKNSSLDPGNE